jgi:endonuclease-3
MDTTKTSARATKKRDSKTSPSTSDAPRNNPRKSEALLKPAKHRRRKPKLFKGTELKSHAAEIEKRLLAEYPTAHCELDYKTPFQLVVATILSAQCTDKRVNMVTPALFAKYPTVDALAAAKLEDIEALGNAFGINVGIVVDTHVARLSARFGLTRETDPVKIERALIPLFPQAGWTTLSHLMIWHGRRTCDARKPKCGECVVRDICPSAA